MSASLILMTARVAAPVKTATPANWRLRLGLGAKATSHHCPRPVAQQRDEGSDTLLVK